MLKALITCCLLFAGTHAYAQNLYLKNIRIVDVVSGKLLPQKELLITKGKIMSLQPKKRQVRGHQVLDGGGRYVIPGLFDMHAHLGAGNRNFLKSFLQYGVTGVRVMAGDDRLLALRDSIRQDLVRGPGLYVASPLYDGKLPLWGDSHTGPTLEHVSEVEALVRLHQQKGYDEVKVYNRLSPEVYLEILRVADAAGLRVSGHIPYTLPAHHFGDTRHRSVEHLDGFVQYATLLPPVLEHGREEVGRRSFYTQYDSAKLAPFADRLKQNKVWLCPTLSLYANFSNERVRQDLDQVKLQEPAKSLLGWWSSLPAQVGENFALTYGFNRRLLQEHFLDYGDYLLAGTDSPNPYNLPGLALHHELEYLTEAGFSPAAVLKMATYNAANYLGVLQEQGTVAIGKDANLLLLNENPLLDIRSTQKIHLVLLKGQVVSR